MTNALTTAGLPSLPDLVFPALPRALAWCATQKFAGEDMLLGELTADEIRQAWGMLPAARACCAPAIADDIQQWMEVVAISVGTNAPMEIARNARIALVIQTCGDLPLGCWTAAARVQFARTRGAKAAFFPTDGEVDAILRPYAWRMRRELQTLEAIVEEGRRRKRPVVVPPVEETPARYLVGEARDKVLAHVSGLTREWMQSRMGARTPDFSTVAGEMAPEYTLSGRALWEHRNRVRQEFGHPPLPEPASFETYGPTPRTRKVA